MEKLVRTRYEVSDALPATRSSKDPTKDRMGDIEDIFERLCNYQRQHTDQ